MGGRRDPNLSRVGVGKVDGGEGQKYEEDKFSHKSIIETSWSKLGGEAPETKSNSERKNKGGGADFKYLDAIV